MLVWAGAEMAEDYIPADEFCLEVYCPVPTRWDLSPQMQAGRPAGQGELWEKCKEMGDPLKDTHERSMYYLSSDLEI